MPGACTFYSRGREKTRTRKFGARGLESYTPSKFEKQKIVMSFLKEKSKAKQFKFTSDSYSLLANSLK